MRIYNPSGDGGQLRVRLLTHTVIAEALVTLQSAELSNGIPYKPSYGEVFLDSRTFPQLVPGIGNVIVEISPLTPMRFLGR